MKPDLESAVAIARAAWEAGEKRAAIKRRQRQAWNAGIPDVPNPDYYSPRSAEVVEEAIRRAAKPTFGVDRMVQDEQEYRRRRAAMQNHADLMHQILGFRNEPRDLTGLTESVIWDTCPKCRNIKLMGRNCPTCNH